MKREKSTIKFKPLEDNIPKGGELYDYLVQKEETGTRPAAQAPPPADGDGPGPSSGMMDRGRPKRAADGGPPERAQRNFTDPDSRLLKTRDGYLQGYNG